MFSHVRARKETVHRGEIETFDVTIFDEQDRVVAEIEGYAMRRIADPVRVTEETSPAPEAVESGGEQPIEIAPPPGIQPREGARILTRILLADAPSGVVAVAEPLQPSGSGDVASPQRIAVASASAAGAEDIESTLSAWWQELLGVEQVNPDDDFFALGGHSLTGVRLFARIKKVYRCDLELATLFEARTVRQLAARIRDAHPQQATSAQANPVPQKSQRAWSTLVAVQPEGARPPFFCVHANSGDVLFYEQLGRALAPDQPLYAFQSPLVAEPERTDVTIESMAALYIREMRAFYPSGPYLLGSASFGGFIVYEMARQLEEQGITPAMTLILDLSVPGSGERLDTVMKLRELLKRIRQGGVHYLRKKAKEKSAYFQDKFLNAAVYPALLRCYLAAEKPLPNKLRYHYHSKAHWRAFANYRFRPFSGKITLIRAIDRGPEALGQREDPTLGWGSLALGGVHVIDVPTGHFDMLLDPYVQTFAGQLKKMLAEAVDATASHLPQKA
jgi:thioesterase domain-containing protein/acyl carrier protein